ncbi:potassium-transporting ATPase subunit F, partial [Sinorhizobium meliloti]
ALAVYLIVTLVRPERF